MAGGQRHHPANISAPVVQPSPEDIQAAIDATAAKDVPVVKDTPFDKFQPKVGRHG